MRGLVVLLVAIGVLALTACNGSQPEPTPDIEATVSFAVEATLAAENALDATVETRVAATVAAPVPVSTVAPSPAATPTPTSTPRPTPTSAPTRTVAPTVSLPPTPTPTLLPAPTPRPSSTLTPGVLLPTASLEEWASIQGYAADKAGGPGAIYVGDLGQLVGPSPNTGSRIGYEPVPLEALERHRYVYESEYYQDLIRRARLDDPTPMTSRVQSPIAIQYACVNRGWLWCDLAERYFAHNLLTRTDGQVEIVSTSFPELGIAGPDTLYLLRDDVLHMAEVFGPYVAGQLPQMDILSLYGLYSDREQQYQAVVKVIPELEKLIVEETGGYPIGVNWGNGGDFYIFSQAPILHLEDFSGMKTRSYNAPLSDWIHGMGATPFFLAFAEVYSALERGNIDASVFVADAGHGQRWYEVSSYLAGPVISWPVSFNIINGEEWDSIPRDLQEIIKEESAKFELEALRLAAIQNDYGLQPLSDAGMEHIEFSPEMRWASERAALGYVIPNWVQRMGGPQAPFVEVFNRIHDPLIGVRIESHGAVIKTE